LTVKMGGALVLLLVAAVLAAGLWYQRQHPRRIVSSGTLEVPAGTAGAPVRLAVRTLAIGPRRIEEIRLPNGTWIDCAGDCGKAAREAGPEFWRTIERNSGR
jgi:hypothetical protein